MTSLLLFALVAASAARAEEEVAPPPLLDDPTTRRQTAPGAPAGEVDLSRSPFDPTVPLSSAAGCVAGGVLGPAIPLALAVPTAVVVGDNPELLPPGVPPACAGIVTVLGCVTIAAAALGPCSALGATLSAVFSSWLNGREPWRACAGGLPGLVCTVVSPLSCACLFVPIPGTFVVTLIGAALALAGPPLAVLGVALLDSYVVERVVHVFTDEDDDEKTQHDKKRKKQEKKEREAGQRAPLEVMRAHERGAPDTVAY